MSPSPMLNYVVPCLRKYRIKERSPTHCTGWWGDNYSIESRCAGEKDRNNADCENQIHL